jgi:hypothetical protein
MIHPQPPAPRPARLTWAAVGLAALVLVIRRPWALLTPQLWAEDGSVHLLQNDQFGAGALFLPYRGYLHLLPRLIAWLASHAADVTHWPLLYNGAAFLIMMALLARFASSRLDLPGKPWLVLAFVLAAHTNEVFFNITNLHWVTAFFLLQQVLIARPATAAQRIGDLLLTAVIGLTGPFVVVFLPLFGWRWLRDRHPDNVALLLTAAACAAIQGYFIVTTGPHFDQQALPLRLGMMLTVTGSRLVVWPLFGAAAAEHMPWPALGAIGVAFIGSLLVWTLRPGPRRLLHAQIVLAFVLILAAGLNRIRPDTWAIPDIVNGDSYFYIPRVLLAWLLIWETVAVIPMLRHTARALCGCAVLLQLPDLHEPAPVDYHWAQNCGPIRRHENADIPILPEGWILLYRPRLTP